jgi:IrrE N-terminal-like domain
VQRGFKAAAERIAAEQRQLLGLSTVAPLLARLLANHHRIILIEPAQIPGMTPAFLTQLLIIDPSAWSGVTLEANSRVAIIYNSEHSPARQESDIMHELSHIFCNHQPTQLVQLNNLPIVLRSFDSTQEDEASWLSGCLKLPRPALLWARQRGMDDAAIAAHFEMSIDLAIYRRNKTGVDRQLTWARHR